jgi:TatD DNase family protein
MIIDAHCHLTHFLKKNELETYLKNSNVNLFLLGGYDEDDWNHQITLFNNFSQKLKYSFGFHPWYTNKINSPNLDEKIYCDLTTLKNYIANYKPYALGECGLDFHKKNEPINKIQQVKYFSLQLEMAKELNLPIILHVVQAHDEAIKILKPLAPFQGIIHSFKADLKTAFEYINLGLILSFGPNILKPLKDSHIKMLKEVPLSSICLETDSPDQIKEPNGLEIVALRLANLRGINIKDMLNTSSKNIKRAFNL